MMNRAAFLLCLSLASCATAPQPVTISGGAVCEGLRPDFPLTFHVAKASVGGGPGEDQKDTVAHNRRVNARFASLCP